MSEKGSFAVVLASNNDAVVAGIGTCRVHRTGLSELKLNSSKYSIDGK